MKRLLLIALLVPFSSFANNDDFNKMINKHDDYRIVFELGMTKAQHCHTIYALESIIFSKRSHVDSQKFKDLNKSNADIAVPNEKIDEIYSYTGDQMEYLNKDFDKCIQSVIREYGLN